MSTLNATAESAMTDDLPTSTYALLERAAARFGDAPALSFIPDADDFRTCARGRSASSMRK